MLRKNKNEDDYMINTTDRARFGIPKIDSTISGGLPANSSTLLYGTPGVGKSIVCQKFMYEGIKNGEKCIFMTFDVRPDTIVDSMKRFGWDPGNKITFFDCFSYRMGAQSPSKYAATGLSDLNQLGMIFEDIINALDGAQKRLVIDSLSTLLLYSDPELVPKFLKDFIATAIAEKTTILMTVEEGVHDSHLVSMLNYLSDGFIEMKFEMDKRFLRISKMRDTVVNREWKEYDITKKGIVFK
jgi:circadian clock protein KaiC